MAIESHRQIIRSTNRAFTDIILPIGGQWALQNNEVNGWGLQGPLDDSNTQDLGDYATYTTLNPQQLGGLRFPIDVELVELDLIYRCDTNATLDWKWLIYTQTKTMNSGTRVTTLVYDGTLGVAGTPTQYTQSTIVTGDLTNAVLTAGDFLCLAAGTPTQIANRTVQVYGGYIRLRPIYP